MGCVARERRREINKQMKTKIKNRERRDCLRSDEQEWWQSSGVKWRFSRGGWMDDEEGFVNTRNSMLHLCTQRWSPLSPTYGSSQAK